MKQTASTRRLRKNKRKRYSTTYKLENRYQKERNLLLLTVALYLAIAVSGLFVSSNSQKVRELYQLMDDTQKAKDSLLAEHSRLLLERSLHSTYQNVDRVAELQLKMVFPESIERVVY